MAGALNVPVAVMESAGEGGAWGIALVAYMLRKKKEKHWRVISQIRYFQIESHSVEPKEDDRKIC